VHGRQQQQIDFTDCEFCGHLRRCGLSDVQARLAGLVFRRGVPRDCDGERFMVLTISSREAAAILKCNDRSVRDAAATLSCWGWWRELKGARGKPPTYVLDDVGARAMVAADDQLTELLAGEVRATAGHCGPLRATAGPSSCSYQDLELKPVSHSTRVHTTGTPHSPAPTRTTPHHSAPQAAGERELPRLPWARRGGVGDPELIAACRDRDLELLRLLFDQAVSMGWIASASEDAWLRFLTGCHHCATARLTRRMGRLVTFVRGDAAPGVPPLDVSRMQQRSEQWAGEVIRGQHRDPALVALGRTMPSGEE